MDGRRAGETFYVGQLHIAKMEMGLYGHRRIQQGREKAFEAEGITRAKATALTSYQPAPWNSVCLTE